MLHQLKVQANYDERQIMERGRAFQYAYLTMLGCLLLLYAVHGVTGLNISLHTMFSIPFWVSATVLHFHTVRRNAFDGLTGGWVSPVLAAVMLGAGLFITGLDLYKLFSGREQLVQAGMLTGLAGSMVSGLCMIVTGLVHWHYRRMNTRATQEE